MTENPRPVTRAVTIVRKNAEGKPRSPIAALLRMPRDLAAAVGALADGEVLRIGERDRPGVARRHEYVITREAGSSRLLLREAAPEERAALDAANAPRWSIDPAASVGTLPY